MIILNSRELIISAFKGEPLERPPFWFMRQAGRHLPEYMKLRERYSFEERSQTPELAAEITLQPVLRYDVDVAIIFSDILIPVYAMDRELKIIPEKGPIIGKPVTPESVFTLPDINRNDYSYLPESIRIVRKELPNKAIAGFSGAPFTIASYLIEGKSTRDALQTKKFALMYPKEYDALLNYISDIIAEQLNSQIDAGADFVQIFDSWALYLGYNQFEKWSLPYLNKIINKVTDAPIIYYSRGSAHILPHVVKLRFDGYSVDNTISLNDSKTLIDNRVLQGNLDPAYLLSTPELITNSLNSLPTNRYIFNLSTGINRNTPVENVEFLSNYLRDNYYDNN